MRLKASHHGTVTLRLYVTPDEIPPFIMGYDKNLAQPEVIAIRWDWWTREEENYKPDVAVKGRKLKKDGTVGLQSVEYRVWDLQSSQDLVRGEESLRRIAALVVLYQPWADLQIRAAKSAWAEPVLPSHE